MSTSKIKMEEKPGFKIMKIRGRNDHVSDSFLSKKKTSNKRGHLPTYEAKLKILLKKILLRLSNFFDPLNIFYIKSTIKFGLFLDKNGNLICLVTLLENVFHVFHEYLKNGTFL